VLGSKHGHRGSNLAGPCSSDRWLPGLGDNGYAMSYASTHLLRSPARPISRDE
jgi:hypothetical protein